ncbi:MAG: hypothetical protein IJZ39_01280 [Oscillospiraceae bacterium]|nr:hypothetical protein [Oscillospiraceae bacterium]
MADRLIRSETLAEIADAIRIKTDSGAAMAPGDMAALILQMGFCNMPGYHDSEAVAVMDRIRDLQAGGGNFLVFGVMADSHVHMDAALTQVSARHGAFAMEIVGRWAGCTFLADLGDNGWEGEPEGAAYLNRCIAAGFSHIRSYRLVGECDWASDPEQVYAQIGIHNVFDAAAATARRGFGYTDYEAGKVRLIVLNTSDCCGASAGYGMSYEQKDFLLRALDLSEKDDSSQWQILLLSHYPLDYPGDGCYNTAAEIKTILNAYQNGNTVLVPVNSDYAAAEGEAPAAYATYSNGYLVYDYSEINTPRIIGNFHGHVHNASYGNMAGHGVLRVASPNACFYLENGSVEELYTVDAAQPKTENSAEDTAVTFYAVDLDNHVIHSLAYGAGEDREIPYS